MLDQSVSEESDKDMESTGMIITKEKPSVVDKK